MIRTLNSCRKKSEIKIKIKNVKFHNYNTVAGDESYLSGRQLHAVADLGWCGFAGVAA